MRTFLLLPAIASLAACSSLISPPVACDDAETKALLDQIVREAVVEELDGQGLGSRADTISRGLIISYSAVRADSFDEAVHRYSCQANITVALPPRVLSAMREETQLFQIMRREGLSIVERGIQAPLRYTSQAADGGEHHYVEAEGHRPLAEAVYVASEMGAFDRESATGQIEAQTPPSNP